MWVRDGICDWVVFDGDRAVPGEELAVAASFDALFTEVQFQIATGRLPYFVGRHTFSGVDGDVECINCHHLWWIPDKLPEDRSCRLFHPRIM